MKSLLIMTLATLSLTLSSLAHASDPEVVSGLSLICQTTTLDDSENFTTLVVRSAKKINVSVVHLFGDYRHVDLVSFYAPSPIFKTNAEANEIVSIVQGAKDYILRITGPNVARMQREWAQPDKDGYQVDATLSYKKRLYPMKCSATRVSEVD